MSLGGRIVLLNSILNAIPIFFLFFMKIPAKVLCMVTRIQRDFLWGGVRGGRKTCWVKWRKICTPRTKGGLGVRDVKLVNLSLIAKWKWRLLQSDIPLWKVVLRDKYEDSISGFPLENGSRWLRFTSGWWKELMLMLLEGGEGANWFSTRVVRKVSNGRDTNFWKNRWLGEKTLASAFPRLYSISSQQEAKVCDMWGLENWNLSWRRQPFVWERNLITGLLATLEGSILGEEADRWLWLPEDSGVFSVSSSYKVLENLVILEEGVNVEEEGIFSKLWKSPAPSKVVAFSWMALLNRIPTRSNLALRHILAPGESRACVLCGIADKTTNHLFLHCDVVSLIWRKVMDWLDVNFLTPHIFVSQFACWSDSSNSRLLFKAFCLIWHAVVWSVWKERNARIFKNQFKRVDEVFDDIKALSWCWALSRLRIQSCLFYEWTWNPRECLKRR